MRYVTVVGARPQFIKAAPLSAALRREHEELLVHTGQHYDDNMSAVFFRELDIPAPDTHLEVGSGTHGVQTARMLERIEHTLEEVRPDGVIVYGDTNSTLAGALAAAKLNIPVAHVEAGLRSHNRQMPEEINRVLTDHLAHWLLAPSRTAVAQLASEGITQGVHEVGDIMSDTVRHFAPLAAGKSSILERLGLRPKQYYVATVHRAGNTDVPSRLASILDAFRRLPLPVVLPLHPRTRSRIDRYGIPGVLRSSTDAGDSPESTPLRVIEPAGYLDMLQLLQHAAAALTDSGGLQKEAYYLEVPCVTLRDETEWVETVEAGWNVLAGCDTERIVAAVAQVTQGVRPHPELYGDGRAAERIVEILGR